ncbi:mannitol-1-phosphate 5-dehydrogenase [Halobacillus salinarum]|uniref:Mannitol-1-phosphate 5-dehydrogenase n=1 Tax=Halobacillus salinarum TaxID=2932257 RepID=A0ABY4EI71_9BACI|nr:mannitol-1-phosphate 5-dehydrogenase [Halobacillus salinarum]UOQ43816.1 mannitol-1-phosphate 5-dehydrogenase [Halobacillus salinarum]
MKAVHFGAGNIGRGFIGALLTKAGYHTTFVDVNDALIQAINDKGTYEVQLAGSDDSIQVSDVSGINSSKEKEAVIKAITEADLITTAVGPAILSIIAPLLKDGLALRSEEVNVIACENMIGGSEQLKSYVLDHADEAEASTIQSNVGFPNAAVDRIVPDQSHADLLTVKVEPYFEWVVETAHIKGQEPKVEGMTLVEDLTPYIERKLFTVNTGHAAAAYLGRYKGHKTIKQAMDDQDILTKVNGALKESGAVLIEKYGFTPDEHQKYIDTIIGRFLNPDLSDEVTRVGRGPIRKLGPKDRLVRPASEYMKWTGKSPDYLAEVIAAALFYSNEADEEAVKLEEKAGQLGRLGAFKEIAELSDEAPLVQVVEEKLKQLA